MNLTCEVSLIMTTHVKGVTIATNTISLKSYILQYIPLIISLDKIYFYINLVQLLYYTCCVPDVFNNHAQKIVPHKTVLSMIYPYNGHAL